MLLLYIYQVFICLRFTFASLSASTHIYKRVCPSLRCRWSVRHAFKKNRLFSVADDIKKEWGSISESLFYTHICIRMHLHMHSRARLKSMRLRNPADERLQNTQAPEAFILFSDFFSYIVPLFIRAGTQTYARAHPLVRTHTHTCKRIHTLKSAAVITKNKKGASDGDDE